MQIEVRIDSACKEPKVVVFTDKITDAVNAIVEKLAEEAPRILVGFGEDTLKVLEPGDIIRIYSAGGKVFAVLADGEYTLRQRLYVLEEWLDKRAFVRISQSEIINLKHAKSFDLSIAGTICVCLSDGSVSYASRRCVAQIKRMLGI